MKHLSAFAFFLLVLSGLTGPAYSQSNELQFEHLTEKQGLSHSSVTRILQDKEGFMWFGAGGLNKYDGYSFRVFTYDPNNRDHTLQGDGVRAIDEDNEGNIWVATIGGLSKVDKRTGTITPLLDLLGPGFLSMCQDRQGIFWIGTIRGLIRLNPKTTEFVRYPHAGYLDAVVEDSSGRLWTFGARILHFDPSSGKYTPVTYGRATDTSLSFNAAHLDKEAMLWIGSSTHGLMRINTKTEPLELTRYNPGGLINQHIIANGIFEDDDGFIWLATSEGLQRVNKTTNEINTYRSDPRLPGTLSSNHVQCVYKDRDGVLWVGTDNGINKAIAHQKPFRVYQVNTTSLPVRLPENTIETILEDPAGLVWLGNQKGLYQFNPRSGEIRHIDANPTDPGSLSSEGVRVIYEDRLGRIWVSTKDALHRFDRATGKFVRYPTEFFVVAMDEDPSGKLWIAGRNSPGIGAIASLDSATHTFRYYYKAGKDTGLSHASLYAIMASRTGNIWVGSSTGGINRLNPKTGKFTYYLPDYRSKKGHLNDNRVVALYEDEQGFIWIGTGKGGLNRFDPQTNEFTSFTTREGMSSNQVVSIISDEKGNIWLGTSKGISRFNPATKSFRNFDVSDGLPDNSFNIGSAYRRNGKLLFGSAKGFVIFHPDSIKDNTRPPPVYITGLKVLEKSRPLPTGSLELPHGENYLSFDFVALNYDAPEKNQYAYMLEGLDKDWIYSNSRRYASYTSLPHGSYTFRVKASNNDGVWNEKGASLSILIHPPWWRTWWAYAFYGLCFLAGLFFADRYQRRRLVKRERERSREKELAQAKEIEKAYHELKTTQAQLIQSEKMASLGELTAGIAHEIQNPLNFVNNFSEVNTELIAEMKEEIDKGNMAEIKAIANDIEENELKITHHGKRADAIVKGMLQHSRSSTGKKEPTDINALADEYLRLSYHGLRAKDKSFNANFKTDFDESLTKIEVIPQDFGRVLLNLYNNAFYSVNEKKKRLDGAFEPEVFVSTKSLTDKVEICVKDNGTGISQEVLNKIYQPFFTTKPTGQGTGLGLSMSYDIIRAHGGELKVETKEGEFAEFIIVLPVK